MALDGIVRMVDAFFRHCLRWLMQQTGGRSRCREEPHIAENIDLFDFSLSDEEMRRISALRKRNIRIAARVGAEMGCRDGRLNARPAPICRFFIP
jgi:hypothetical protein